MAQICFISLIPKREQASCALAQGSMGHGEEDVQGLLVSTAGHALGYMPSTTLSTCFGKQNYC